LIWCPRHPAAKLVRTQLGNGKIELRCPDCTKERLAAIKVVSKPRD
jgi:hypothetical protein